MYEIDRNIKTILPFSNESEFNIIYSDFLQENNVSKKYQTIVGNPPFVRTKKGNLYIDFIKKCYNLLEYNGELIFIVPTDFFKLSSSSNILNNMIEKGTFTDIFHPNKEQFFQDASIDIVVFRYCKNEKLEKKTSYNDEMLYINNQNGLITFSKEDIKNNYIYIENFPTQNEFLNEYLLSKKEKNL